ncbi:MAG: hemerythrin domain-containing protein [Gammaproteobacteria bacterium]|nr:MAG: hemerythrin domain-containing protein [Gammaproteobacteria bacterium]
MTTIARKIRIETSSQLLDAISFLSSVQRDILDLFNQFGKSSSQKQLLARKICTALMIAMQVEEEGFYPVVKKAIKENGNISAAIMKHSIMKYLISEIESLDEDSTIFDIKVSVLGEHVKEHFMAEQLKLFPKIVASQKVDLWTIGSNLASRKTELESSSNLSFSAFCAR